MSNYLVFLRSMIYVLCVVTTSWVTAATVYLVDTEGEKEWGVGVNWTSGSVPGRNDVAEVGRTEALTQSAIISDGGNYSVGNLVFGREAGWSGTLKITNGTLNTYGGNTMFGHGGSGFLELNGENAVLTIQSGSFYVGNNSTGDGTINVTKGTFTNKANFFLGVRTTANLNISEGGKFISTGSIQLGHVQGAISSGTITQTGGVSEINSIQFGNNTGHNVTGTIDISGGTMSIQQITKQDSNNKLTANFLISGDADVQVAGDISIPVTMTGGNLSAGSFRENTTISSGTLRGALNADGKTRTLTVGAGKVLALQRDLGSNIALGQATSQISTYSNNSKYDSSKAVDGIIQSGDGESNITHTGGGKYLWWQVELDKATPITNVKLYNRYFHGETGKNERLVDLSDPENPHGFYFEIYDGTIGNEGNLLWTSPEYFDYTREGMLLTFGDVPENGTILRLVRECNSTDFLNLKEVEVFSATSELPTLEMNVFADKVGGYITTYKRLVSP
ncbi:MAG: hypothetical protein Q4C70_00865 [Planctomycetia bacterium]|nr:hypothetical protein [Planctomycetia bacterium]